ncbi:MAG: divergent polysaccharide deacetylase family protein [Magnetococcus sp. MYC-9]
MNSLRVRGNKPLLGWLAGCVVVVLTGWGGFLLIDREADQGSAPVQTPADPKVLRLTLSETIRVPTAAPRPTVSPETTVAPAAPAATEPPTRADQMPPPQEPVAAAGSILYEEPLAEKKPAAPRHSPTAAVPGEKKTGKLHTLALIIDDLGYDGPLSRAVVALPADITLAVLPHGPHAREIAGLAKAAGRELLLHQPMEPRRYPQMNPGPGAMLVGMDAARLQAVLRANLEQLPEAVGINNHMGSRLTEREDAMDAVMEVLVEKKLFFIDSRTSEVSVGMAQAVAGHVPTAARDIFIDNIPEEKAILRQLAQLERMAHKQGEVIGIGHPYRSTVAALQQWLPTLEGKGIQLQRVSRFIRPGSARALYPDHPTTTRAGGHRRPPDETPDEPHDAAQPATDADTHPAAIPGE